MGHSPQPIAVLIAVLAAISAVTGLYSHPCAARGRIAHTVMCLAMVAMLIPNRDPLGPLIWAMLLGGFGVWVADTPVPPAWRLPLIADLTLMAVLLLFAPAPGIDPHATTFHEHNHTTGSGWISVPILAMIAWASLRLHLWRTGRGGYPVRRSTTATVAHLAMTAAMILMAITHTLPH